MIKRDITETIYEYDKEGKLLKKTVIETHEEESNTITTMNPNWALATSDSTNKIASMHTTITN